MERQLRNTLIVAAAIVATGAAFVPDEAKAQYTQSDTQARESIVTPPGGSTGPILGPIPAAGPSGPTRSTTGVALSPSQLQLHTDLMVEANSIDDVALLGESDLAARTAREFGVRSSQILRQRRDLNASWSDLWIAYTLAANALGRTTVTRLFDLRAQGQDWGTIASALGMNAGQFLSAIRQEARVASGLVRPDGRVQTIARGTTMQTASTKTTAKVIRGSGAVARTSWD